MTRRNLIIVDDFLDNPDVVRAYALEQQFERLGGKNWPGRDSSCLLYTSPSPRDRQKSRMPSSA